MERRDSFVKVMLMGFIVLEFKYLVCFGGIRYR